MNPVHALQFALATLVVLFAAWSLVLAVRGRRLATGVWAFLAPVAGVVTFAVYESTISPLDNIRIDLLVLGPALLVCIGAFGLALLRRR